VSHLLNGKSCFEYGALKVTGKGYIALQLHAPGEWVMNFRNIFIQPLNNSFQIPANNAWDSTGKQINVIGVSIKPKFNSANKTKGIPNPLLGYNIQGRVSPMTAEYGNRIGIQISEPSRSARIKIKRD